MGFEPQVTIGPLWSASVAYATEGLLAALGHPCCWQGVGRIDWIGNVARELLDRAFHADHRRRREVLRIPLIPEASPALGSPCDCFDIDTE